jgi:hypothetical protein
MSRTFDELLQSDPSLRRHYELISKVGAESERGMTVLVAAELDRVLKVVLKSYLAPGKAREDSEVARHQSRYFLQKSIWPEPSISSARMNTSCYTSYVESGINLHTIPTPHSATSASHRG